MYARAVNVSLLPDKVAEAQRIVADAIVPVLQAQKGFQRQLFLTQPASGKAVSITTSGRARPTSSPSRAAPSTAS